MELRTFISTLTIAAAALAATACPGQEAISLDYSQFQAGLCGTLERGAKIRVRYVPGPKDAAGSAARLEVGKLESCADGSLVIRPESGSRSRLEIPLASVENVQVLRRTPGHAVEGALLGFAVGIFASFAAQTHTHQDEFLGGLEDMETNLTRGVGITVGTTLLGAAIGSAVTGSHWDDVDVGAGAAVSVTGSRGGVGLTVACSF